MMDAQVKRTPGRLDRSRQAAPQILETLRQRILSIELRPNTLLSRAALQSEFGVSQTPVRDALMKLEQEGLVEIYPQHATVVARIDVGAAQQAHFLRVAIELEAVRRVASEGNAGIVSQMKESLKEQRRLLARKDYVAFVAADQAFHKLFYDAARVPGLWDIMRRQSGHIDRLRLLNLPLPGKPDAVIKGHEAIVTAVERGKPEDAARALRLHLSGTLSIVDRIREKHPDYFLGE